jgi:hypothetical protein
MEMREVGLYSAVAVYGVIALWTVLVRLRLLPGPFVCLMQKPLVVLAAVSAIGPLVRALRRWPLSVGMLLAALVGIAVPYIAVPYIVLGVMWGAYVLSFGVTVAAAITAIATGVGESESDEPDPNRLYFAKHGHDLVYGSSPHADPIRPLGGG